MKLLNKNTDYAIRALVVLSRKAGEFVSVKQVAEKEEVPYEYLRKIFQQLLKEKFVESKGGGQGGFRIAKEPVQIKVAHVIQAFQGELQLSDCMFRKKICTITYGQTDLLLCFILSDNKILIVKKFC